MPASNIAIRLDLEGDRQVGQRLDRLGDDGQRALQRIERGATPASRGLTLLNDGLVRLRGTLAGIAAGVSVGWLANATRDAISTAAAIGDVADRVGVTVEALQELRLAAETNGSSAATLDMAMQRFSRRVGEAAAGTGVLSDVLEDLNISIRNSDGTLRSNEDILEDYAAAIRNAESDQEALRLAFQAFDSEGASLLALMRQYPEVMRDISGRFEELGFRTSDQVREAQDLDDQLTELSSSISNNLSNALLSLGPLLVTVTGYMADLARITRTVVDAIDQLPNSQEMQRLDTSQLPADWLAQWEGGTLRAPDGASVPTGVTFDQWFNRTPGQMSADWGAFGPESGLYRMRPYTQPGTPETEADRRDRERVAAHEVARLAGIEWLGGTTNVTTDPFAALPPWERPASGSGGAGGGGGGGSSAADTAAERIRDRVAELQREIEAQDRLMAALGEGEDAYRRMEATIRAETDALRLGIDLTGEQGQAFIDLSVAADESNQRTRDMLGLISDANAAMRQFAPAVDTVAEAQAALNAAIEAGVGDVDAYRAALETAKKQAEFSSKANQEALEGQLDAMRRQQDFQDGLTSGAVEWADAIRAGGDELDKMLAGLEDWDDIFYQTVVRPWVERQFSGLFGPVASGAGSLGLFGGGGVPANDNSGGGGWLSGLTGWFDRVFGSLPGFAHGTSSAPAGWAWVGENGPELVRFRGRESVTPLRTALGPSILDSLFADRFHGLASGGGIGGALLAGPNALLNGFFGLLGAGGDVITEFLSLFLGAGRGRSDGGAPDPYSAMVAGRGGSPGMASGPGLLRGLLDLVPAFAGGGSFFAGSGLPRIPSSGIDDRLLIARTHVGERWQATPRGQAANATTTMIDAPVNVTAVFPNANVDDFQRNEVAFRRMLADAASDAQRYGLP